MKKTLMLISIITPREIIVEIFNMGNQNLKVGLPYKIIWLITIIEIKLKAFDKMQNQFLAC
jgi:hypothetical protein